MTLSFDAFFLLVVYASLILEITVFPIPSEASTYQIFFREAESSPEGRLRAARSRRPTAKLLVYFLPTALGVLLFLVPLVVALFPGSMTYLGRLTILESAWVHGAGVAVVLVARAITFTSVLQLRRRRRQDSYRLQQSGWFKLSRNPGLVGMFTLYLGLCLMFPCLVLLIGFLPYVWNMHRKVLMEESYLAEVLGDSYRRYLEQVPRYLLF